MFRRLSPYLIVAGLGLAFFAPLVAHPAEVLYSDHSDLLAMHLPLKRFLVRSWQETGEVPLWCPYSFGGMPLAHDVQVAAFYPLHLPLYLLPEEWIAAAMSWLVVMHVLIAGWCMIAYARHQGLEGTGLLVAAAGYMFAGKWLLHVLAGGHYIMAPLAWLPVVLLLLERALERRSLLLATGAGLAFALIVVSTHPQMTLYAGLFVGLWTWGCGSDCRLQNNGLGPSAIGNRQSAISRVPFLSWLAFGCWSALVAVGASAIQLLPAVEATSEASRAAGVPARDILQAGLAAILGLVGPGWKEGWEDRAGLGILWVGAAVLAPLLQGGRTRSQAAVALGLVVFAFGGAALFQGLPGLRLFQIPVRMLMLLALPVALLAGRTTQVLLEPAGDLPSLQAWCRGVLLRVAAGGLLLSALAAACSYHAWQLQPAAADAVTPLTTHHSPLTLLTWLETLPTSLVLYWPVAVAALAVAAWLLGSHCRLSRPAWGHVWLGVLLADLWALTWPHVAVRPEQQLYSPSSSVELLVKKKTMAPGSHWRVLDRGLPGEPSSSPLGSALSLLGGVELEPVLGYNSFDVRRYKEYLQWITDADEEIRPRSGLFGYPIVGSFPIQNKRLLDLLGVRFLIQPAEDALGGSGEPWKDPSWRLLATDDGPRVYSFLAGGMQQLPPFHVYENSNYLPRALLVPRAGLLRERSQVLEQMKDTDFREVVLLERPLEETQSSVNGFMGRHAALIRQYRPNRVVIDTICDSPAYLVLNDVWYPGWTCKVDGSPAELHRANFLFRAVALPPGAHEVAFLFAPDSYRWGKTISALTLLGVAVLFILGVSLGVVGVALRAVKGGSRVSR